MGNDNVFDIIRLVPAIAMIMNMSHVFQHFEYAITTKAKAKLAEIVRKNCEKMTIRLFHCSIFYAANQHNLSRIG